MQKVTYLAVFEPCEDGYSVYFPDLPGCISCGETFEVAQREAAEALGLHLCGMEEDGLPVPPPSEHPVIDPETAAGYLISPVTAFPELVGGELNHRETVYLLSHPATAKEILDGMAEDRTGAEVYDPMEITEWI